MSFSTRSLLIVCACLGLAVVPAAVLAQEDGQHDEHASAHEVEEHEHRNEIAVFGGALTDTKHDDTGPAIGVEYARLVARGVYVAGLLEYASTELERETVLLGVVAFYPGGFGFRLAAGLGAEFANPREGEEEHGPETLSGASEETDSEGSSTAPVLRLGTGYGFRLPGRYKLLAEFNVDFIGGDISRTTLVYGLTFSVGF